LKPGWSEAPYFAVLAVASISIINAEITSVGTLLLLFKARRRVSAYRQGRHRKDDFYCGGPIPTDGESRTRIDGPNLMLDPVRITPSKPRTTTVSAANAP
jgi:hypothetical protein